MEQTQAAATADELRARFTQAGYYVYSVKPKGMAIPGLSNRRKKVKLETFLVFNQQFLTLIRAGITILNAMDLLARRQKDLAFRAQLIDAAQRVRNGESVSSAFEAQETFPLIYVTTLMAGEKTATWKKSSAATSPSSASLSPSPKNSKPASSIPRCSSSWSPHSSSSSSDSSFPASPSSTIRSEASCPPSPSSCSRSAAACSTTSSMPCPSSRSCSTCSTAGQKPKAAPPSSIASASVSPSSETSGSSIRSRFSPAPCPHSSRADSPSSPPSRPPPNPWAAAA